MVGTLQVGDTVRSDEERLCEDGGVALPHLAALRALWRRRSGGSHRRGAAASAGGATAAGAAASDIGVAGADAGGGRRGGRLADVEPLRGAKWELAPVGAAAASGVVAAFGDVAPLPQPDGAVPVFSVAH